MLSKAPVAERRRGPCVLRRVFYEMEAGVALFDILENKALVW